MDFFGGREEPRVGLAAVEEGDLVPAIECHPRDVTPEEDRSAEYQKLHAAGVYRLRVWTAPER
ncbi:MAG: hypothetical protein AMXMBFR80_16520 [Dehalococcoidia bacterium]